ncbi:hypothetical protein HKX48_006444 [Thoreauomyces humboldtii]|nr:hypothetical protein HKX48_006444 [Thoreauomyces humboldtii]
MQWWVVVGGGGHRTNRQVRDHRAPDDTPIGYFPLNLGNVPPQATFANDLFDVLSQLLPRCQRISLTLKSLNEERYVSPAQNRDAALDVGLAAGDLQLVEGTWVLVEEAGLEDGTLNERGVGNISNLGKLIRTAKLPYLIPHGEMDREVDYGVLVQVAPHYFFRILPIQVDCYIPLRPRSSSPSTTISTPADPSPLSSTTLQTVRRYLATSSHRSTYEIPPTMVDAITKDYADRRSSGSAVDMTDLSRRLEVAKLLCRSLGRERLDEEIWERSGSLEAERIVRVREGVVGKTDGGAGAARGGDRGEIKFGGV